MHLQKYRFLDCFLIIIYTNNFLKMQYLQWFMDYPKAVIDDDLFDDSITAIKSPQYRLLLKEKQKEENNEDNS